MLKYTQQELKQAHQIVVDDLLKKIKKVKDGESIRLNDWGTFVKKKSKITDWKKRSYLYFRVSFRASGNLKKELDKQL